jgi:cullin 4
MSSFGGRLKTTTNTRFGANKVNARKSKTGTKKLIIQGFKKKPKLPSNFEDESWFKLQKAVRAIHAKQPIQTSREELYRTTEDVCIHKMGARLYTRLQLEFETYTERLVNNLLLSLENSSTASTLAFLSQTERAWEDYCQQTLAVRSIFLYLDRTHVLQSAGSLKSIWSLAMHLLRSCLESKPQVGYKLVEGLISLIKGERKGEAINRSLVRNLIRMYSTLGMYDTMFEIPLIKESKEFYMEEGNTKMDQLIVPDYLKHLCDRYDDEVNRVSHYLIHTSRNKLIAILDEHLLKTHAVQLVNNGFDVLMEQDRFIDLKRMYTFWGRINARDLLFNAFHKYIQKESLEIVMDKESDKDMVHNLLIFRERMSIILSKSFEKNALFNDKMKSAFEHSINQRENRPAELIAKYVDTIMRTGRVPAAAASTSGYITTSGAASGQNDANTTANISSSSSSSSSNYSSLSTSNSSITSTAGLSGDDQLEDALNSVMCLFRYINGKDVFEAFYKKDLAKRLLLNKTASQDLERNFISRLKTECGADFTSKLEGMFKDMTLSKEVMEIYEKSEELKKHTKEVEERIAAATATATSSTAISSAPNSKLQGAVEMHIHVLTTGFWPTYPPSKVRLPNVLNNELKVFNTFYNSKYGGRKMIWQHSLGVVSLRAFFPKGRKELSVSCYQATVLMLFSGMGEGDRLTYSDISEQVDMNKEDLNRTLQSLSCGKVRVIKKRPKRPKHNKDINEKEDYFVVAHDFKDRRLRIKINQIQIKETKKEKKEVHESVIRDRIHVLDAAVVRIMKTRKKLNHNELISEIFNQIKFPAETSSIKKRIESLIDREYIERDEQDYSMYNYLA